MVAAAARQPLQPGPAQFTQPDVYVSIIDASAQARTLIGVGVIAVIAAVRADDAASITP
jgi:hypothetical protein